MTAPGENPRIALLVSGGGRSLENLAEEVRAGNLDVEIALVLSDRPGIRALERAEHLDIPQRVVPYSKDAGPLDYAERVFAEIEEQGCELVVLAGFLRLLPPPENWRGRVINIHPALLPRFGGKGYYGSRVHRAVLDAHETESGCTVHLVDAKYDTGPILLQRTVPVLPEDTPETLASRVFEAEKVALPEAIRQVLASRD